MAKYNLITMPYNPDVDYVVLAKELIDDRYTNGNVQSFMTYQEHKSLMVSLMTDNPTQDMLVFDDGKLIVAYCAMVVEDCHYGEVMMPVVSYIHSAYRGDRALSKVIVEMEQRAALLLDVQRYYRITHKGNGVTEYKLKEVRNGRNRKISN